MRKPKSIHTELKGLYRSYIIYAAIVGILCVMLIIVGIVGLLSDDETAVADYNYCTMRVVPIVVSYEGAR